MKICILGVGRSGTTALYSLLQQICLDQIKEKVDFIYEPFLWDKDQLNGKYEDISEHFKRMNSISIEGIYNHLQLPLFIDDPAKFEGNRFLKGIFNQKQEHVLIKMIRANGRFSLLHNICSNCKFIFIIRNPLDVINSVITRFSFYGAEFHKDDFHRFCEEVNRLYDTSYSPGQITARVERDVLFWYYMNKFALESFENACPTGGFYSHPPDFLSIETASGEFSNGLEYKKNCFLEAENKPLVICYEDYIARPGYWVDKICDFLDLEKNEIYYHYAKEISGSQTNGVRLNRREVELVSVYLDKYKGLLETAGNHPVDADKIMSKYKETPAKSNRKEIITGRTSNFMNARIQQLEEQLEKKEAEITVFKKRIRRLEEKLREQGKSS